mmetsp:Transcript_19536/g.53501  ORF Transcript_19536/g.53501 Transcript_19536/m.53501 type:complete len:248 (+) Transcript_19536:700-1443(+)
MHAVPRMEVSHRVGALAENAARLPCPALVVPSGTYAPSEGNVPLRNPNCEGVLAADLRLDVERRLVTGAAAWQFPGEICVHHRAATRDDVLHWCFHILDDWRRKRAGVRRRMGCRRGRGAIGRFLKNHPAVGAVHFVNRAAARICRFQQACLGIHMRWWQHHQPDIGATAVVAGVVAEDALDLDPGVVVTHDMGVVHARPSLRLPEHAMLNVIRVGNIGPVLHRLHRVLAAIQAMCAAPDLAKGAAA